MYVVGVWPMLPVEANLRGINVVYVLMSIIASRFE